MRRDVRARIKRAVNRWAASSEQRDGMLTALRSEAFPLHRRAPLRAGALSAIAYRLGGGEDSVIATSAAAIAELHMTAGIMLDDVMDEDVTPNRSLGFQAALGLSLLLVGQAALDEAAVTLPHAARCEVSNETRRLVLASCAGQYAELTRRHDFPTLAAMSTENANDITEQKAGSLGEMCAVIGCGLTGALGSDISQRLRSCYLHFHTYRQIIDDLADAPSTDLAKASDFEIGNPTLPVVFHLKATTKLGDSTKAEPRGENSRMEKWEGKAAPTDDDLRSSGTTLFSEMAAEVHFNRALTIAREIQNEQGGAEDLFALIGATSSEGGQPQKRPYPPRTRRTLTD